MLLKKFIKQFIKSHLICVFLILVVGAFVYRSVIMSKGPAMQYNDNAVVFYPAFYFSKHALLDGEFPLWDPYQLFGQPIAFNTYAILYPPLLFVLSLPFEEFYPRHMELLIISHLIVASLALYCGGIKLGISKWGSLIAAVIFAVAPSTNNYVFNPTASFLLAWMPLIMALSIYILRSKEPLGKLRLEYFFLVILLALIFLATSPPLLLYTYITIGLILAFYILTNLIIKPNAGYIVGLVKKFILIITVPNLLVLFLILPLNTYLLETARRIPAPQYTGVGPLYFSQIWTLLFPNFAYARSDSYAYIGLFPLFLILFLLPIFGRKHFPKTLALFTLISSFWFIFAIEKSPLYEQMVSLPLMNSLRFSYRALVFFVLFAAWGIGLVIDSIMSLKKDEERRYTKLWQVSHVILPVTLLAALYISRKYFFEILKIFPLLEEGQTYINYIFTSFGITIVGIVSFTILLTLHVKKRLPKIFIHLFWIIPFLVISIEHAKNYRIHPRRSWYDSMDPYEGNAKDFTKKYPKIVEDRDTLSRVESFGNETPILPYYLNYYSVNGVGYWPQGTHPISYYYLWSADAAMYGHTYQKPTLDTISTTIRIGSPIYRLMGVKYFLTKGVTSKLVPFEDRGIGEFVEIDLKKYEVVTGIKIIQTDGEFKRKTTKAKVYSNNYLIGEFDVSNKPGPQTINFRPLRTNNIKLEATQVTLDTFPLGDGIVIVDLALLGANGIEIPMERVKKVNPSSTFFLSREEFLTDNLPTEWESDNDLAIKRIGKKFGLTYADYGLLMDEDPFPRAFVSSNYTIVGDKDTVLSELHSKNFNPKNVIIYNPKISIALEKSDYFKPAVIDSYKRNTVEISVENEKPGFLVLTDMYSNGWGAYVDGKRQPIFNAYGTFRAVELKEVGKHIIKFRYMPPDFYKGVFISTLALAGLLFYTFGTAGRSQSRKT